MIDTLFTENRNMDALAEALAARGLTVRGRSAQCPWHDDRSPSASLIESDEGICRIYCHVCDRSGDIYDVTGSQPTPKASKSPTIVPEPRRVPDLRAIESMYPQREAIYQYTDPDTGTINLLIVRYRKGDGKKSFAQYSPQGDGWIDRAGPKPWPIYNRTEVRSADLVVVVEGEKCVHALRGANITGTTSPCGAGKASHADWSPLAGKNVYLWPDNDPPDPKTGKRNGIDHMREVQAILERLVPAPVLHWIDPDALGLKPKGDCADLLDDLTGADKLTKGMAILDVLKDAQPIGAAAEVGGLLRAMIAGTHKPVDWPWRKVSSAARALMPGTVTLLCGEAGSTKSFFLLESAAYWHRKGIPLALFELEEDRKYHLHRALAQCAGDSRILDSAWAAENPREALGHYEDHAKFLNSFGACIWEAPDKQVTLEQLTEWVLERSKQGARIVAIDPVTAASANDKPWIADQKFIMAVKSIVRDFQNSLILVTHPTKGPKGKGGPGQISGGAAYMRFSQAALWLSVIEGTPNRELHIIKARNGRGNGLAIGYNFSGSTLCFEEMNVAVEDAPRPARPSDGKPSPTEDVFK